jgi:N6-L-threonylcarbamoyladenine synthase
LDLPNPVNAVIQTRETVLKILGIKTTSDETSASVVEDEETLLSNVVATRLEFHKEYTGIVQ